MTLQKKINLSLFHKLVQGEHLTDKDKNQPTYSRFGEKEILVSRYDKVRLKSNSYDADNEKKANETVEVTH